MVFITAPSRQQDAKDLIRHMLCADPKARWTCEQVLEHPWMSGNAPSEPLLDTLKALKRYNAKRRWKASFFPFSSVSSFFSFSLSLFLLSLSLSFFFLSLSLSFSLVLVLITCTSPWTEHRLLSTRRSPSTA